MVDDQPVHRQLHAGRLIPLGFTVLEAASGRECLEIVAEQAPDAVLLDLSMDDLSGWETARLLRQRHSAPELPIIVVSADLFENQQQHLDAAACQAFVGKPVMDSELFDALARTLATREATYFSRSRNEQWIKGATSGHTQYVHSVRLDCDGDTVLLEVDQTGGACHTGDHSCFDADLLLRSAD